MGALPSERVSLDVFPSVVWDVPASTRASFARIYLDHRATEFAGKRPVVIREERPSAYLEGLREFRPA